MKLHDMVSKFHHERESFFLSCPALHPLENPIDQTALVSCCSIITNMMCDVIHLDWKDLVFCYKKSPFFSALISSSTVYHAPVVLQKCDL